jgi:hypothetical protein
MRLRGPEELLVSLKVRKAAFAPNLKDPYPWTPANG